MFYEMRVLKTPPVWIIIEEPIRNNNNNNNNNNNTLSKDGSDDQCVKSLVRKTTREETIS